MNGKKIIVLSCSGGLDSTTLLCHACRQNQDCLENVIPVFFQYGSKHNKWERKAFDDVLKWLDFPHPPTVVDVSSIFDNVSSALMLNGTSIPTGEYDASNMSQTVVPGRNLVFASICSTIAENAAVATKTNAEVWLGVHSGDHVLYPDCRPAFVYDLREVIFASTEWRVFVRAPLLMSKKEDIVRLGSELGVPFYLTRSCYQDSEFACGKCGTCRERREAFEKAGVHDTIVYQKEVDDVCSAKKV